jgi:hypothetical protein
MTIARDDVRTPEVLQATQDIQFNTVSDALIAH